MIENYYFYHSYSADIPTSARLSATAPSTPIPLLLSQISPHSPASSSFVKESAGFIVYFKNIAATINNLD